MGLDHLAHYQYLSTTTKKEPTVNKLFLIIPSIALLASCSGGKETVYVQVPVTAAATTQPTPPNITAPPTTESVAYLEEMYIRGVRQSATNLWSLTDSQLLELGYMTCIHFQNGGTNEDLINAIIVAGIDNGASEEAITDMAGATGVAVAIICPEYAWKLG